MRRKCRFKHSRRRRGSRKEKGSDESDEDYKLGKDEELAEFNDCYSLEEDESEGNLAEFEELDELMVNKVGTSKAKSSSRTRKASGNKRKKKNVTYNQDDGYSDDDDDEEFMPNEIDCVYNEDETTETKKKKIKKKKKKIKKKKKKKKVLNTPKGQKMKRKTKRNTNLLRKTVRKKSRYTNVKKKRSLKVEKNKKKSSKRKRLLMQDSDSDYSSSGSSRYEYTISEEEREQVREASKLCSSLGTSLRSVSSSKRLKQEVSSHKTVEKQRKGKEKVVDLRNQVCGICLSEEQKRTVRGTLNCCTHYFCFPCIIEWSKVESRCPLCKQRFTTISKPARSNTRFDLRSVSIGVPERNQVYEPSEEELTGYIDPYESITCNECQQGGEDSLMLLCDICDSPAHTYCVGLGREVPEGNWYCEACRPSTYNSQSPTVTAIQKFSNNISLQSTDLKSVHVPDTLLTQETGPSSLRDFHPASPTSPAFTLLDRRRIQSQIRVLISNRRSGPGDTNSRFRLLNSQSDQNCMPSQSLSTISVIRVQDNNSRVQDNNPPLVQHRAQFSSRTNNISREIQNSTSTNDGGMLQYRNEVDNTGSGLLNVEKEQVQHMVRRHMKALSMDNDLGYNTFKKVARSSTHTFKKVARSSTHTILAACGLEHRMNEVYPMQPHHLCNHAVQLSSLRLSLMKDFCSYCFDSFVRCVVEKIASAKTSNTNRV